MLLTILYRLPGLPGAVRTLVLALIWSIALLAALALVVAVCMAVAPHLPMLATAAAIIGGYAMLTMPRSKVVQSC
jgi:hypothetical protein